MKTLFDKIWDAHTVDTIAGGSCVLYIDRQYIHEVTSPQAFEGLHSRGAKVFRPAQVTASPDHNIPTQNQHLPVQDLQSARQLSMLENNCTEHGITIFKVGTPKNGIIHVVGPETGLTQPGMTIVCGDSHTSTHGAMGCVAFGIGTSEVEMVLASQCVLQSKPKTMRINVEGQLNPGVCSKDIILYLISKLGTGGGTGHFIEFAGSAIRSLSMEARMTICNMSIEMGARGGMIAPDETTFAYLKGREYAPQGTEWDKSVAQWKQLYSDPDAVFDKEVTFDAADIYPMITYGTNPGMGIALTHSIPEVSEIEETSRPSFLKALEYMKATGQTGRLCFCRQLYQWTDRRSAGIRRLCERQAKSSRRDSLDRSGQQTGRKTSHRRRDQGYTRGCRLRIAATGMLRLPGNERRQNSGREILCLHLQS